MLCWLLKSKVNEQESRHEYKESGNLLAQFKNATFCQFSPIHDISIIQPVLLISRTYKTTIEFVYVRIGGYLNAYLPFLIEADALLWESRVVQTPETPSSFLIFCFLKIGNLFTPWIGAYEYSALPHFKKYSYLLYCFFYLRLCVRQGVFKIIADKNFPALLNQLSFRLKGLTILAQADYLDQINYSVVTNPKKPSRLLHVRKDNATDEHITSVHLDKSSPIR
ncbi:hypothetical protein EGR_10352 [Echinococcus granulosus]|uniref:Uncharacterized protein n=1 Tax=Echinococcus granulosus TaxID=6210 RepID=W6UMT0_ECHGR|nr:hypothetical protein EGR_10352 [Echinococcus granulosus]EUB54799.1 hypothetical protein EGR_10352 [Echinococcus granulosus]